MKRQLSVVREIDPSEAVELPVFLGGVHSGNSAMRRRPCRGPKAETAWTRAVMVAHADWHDVVCIRQFQSFEVERPVSRYRDIFGDVMGLGRARSYGLPQIDGLGVYSDGSVCIVEAKLDCSTVEMLRGVAQLLYYKFVMEMIEKTEVADLVLASPSWPAYVAEVIDEHKLPIRMLKVTDDGVFGCVPQFLVGDRESAK